MRFRFLLSSVALIAALAFAGAVRADDLPRFSKTLSAAELSSVGVARLSSDQLAILDALVRRDLERSRFASREPRAARFSDRLTADERRNAGIDQFPDAERTALDAAVERLITPPPAAGGTARYAGGYSVPNVKLRREPEIHGSLTLLYGVGSGGYSEYGGEMVLTYEDPADRFAVAVGYSELHTKGGYYYRNCRDGFFRDGFLRRPGDPLY